MKISARRTARVTSLSPDEHARTLSRRLIWMLTGALLVLLAIGAAMPAAAQNGIVVTPAGLFANCSEAVAYRDGPLVRQLDEQFARYQNNVQQRVDEVMNEYREHVDALRRKASGLEKEQLQKLAIDVGRYGAHKLVSKLSLGSLPKEVLDTMTKEQKDIWVTIVNRASTFADEIATAGFTGEQIRPDAFIAAHGDLVVSMLSLYLGPAGLIVVNSVEFTTQTGIALLEADLAFKENRGEYDELIKSMRKLLSESPRAKAAYINRIKNAIDRACG